MTTDTSSTRASDDLSPREVVLRTLRDSSEPRTIVDLAEQLGVHPNTVRFHLESLVGASRVERVATSRTGRGRPPTAYVATVGMDPAGPTSYRFLAALLTSQLTERSPDPAGEARALGHRWSTASDASAQPRAASRDEAITTVVAELADLGFAPEPAGGASVEIRLRHCPFLALVAGNAEVICSLHLGLMQGAFAALDASVTVDKLEPFVQPDLCVARLISREAVSP